MSFPCARRFDPRCGSTISFVMSLYDLSPRMSGFLELLLPSALLLGLCLLIFFYVTHLYHVVDVWLNTNFFIGRGMRDYFLKCYALHSCLSFKSPKRMAPIATGLSTCGYNFTVDNATACFLRFKLLRLANAARTCYTFSITPRERTVTSGLSTIRVSMS